MFAKQLLLQGQLFVGQLASVSALAVAADAEVDLDKLGAKALNLLLDDRRVS